MLVLRACCMVLAVAAPTTAAAVRLPCAAPFAFPLFPCIHLPSNHSLARSPESPALPRPAPPRPCHHRAQVTSHFQTSTQPSQSRTNSLPSLLGLHLRSIAAARFLHPYLLTTHPHQHRYPPRARLNSTHSDDDTTTRRSPPPPPPAPRPPNSLLPLSRTRPRTQIVPLPAAHRCSTPPPSACSRARAQGNPRVTLTQRPAERPRTTAAASRHRPRLRRRPRPRRRPQRQCHRRP